MSTFPIDIINFNEEFRNEIEASIDIANSVQTEFFFSLAPNQIQQKYQLLNFESIVAEEFMPEAEKIRNEHKGFYPYILFITESSVSDDSWSNLFGTTYIDKGLSILTSHSVADVIIPKDKMTAYFVYYLPRMALKFVLKDKYNHYEASENGCLFDFCEDKMDILNSMRAGAFCDNCKREILKIKMPITEDQFSAIGHLMSKSGEILENGTNSIKPRIFIGSSREGLDVARKIKNSLEYDAHVDTWADGIFDKPSQSYIEVLERAVEKFDYGIFVFTADDKIYTRGENKNVPRDNVIFEYGMFLGKHTRKKVFFIKPRGEDLKIMTDLLGITCLDYDPTNSNLKSAVGAACDQIREIISTD
ncbi:MAG: nucleotide-binding protein [Balneola sp.]